MIAALALATWMSGLAAPTAAPTLPPLHVGASPTPAPLPAPFSTPALTPDQMQKIDRIALQALGEQATSGISLAIVRGGSVVYSRGYGYASQELQTTARDASLYEVGSISKEFTATAVLLLAEDGKLTLDDTIVRWVPDLPRAKDITVRELLSMTSGVPDYTDQPSFDKASQSPVTPAGIIATVKSLPLDFEPGTQWEYSNTNYVLLGMVIEKAGGMSYSAFLVNRAFKTAGMFSTTSGNAGASSPDLTTGYAFDGVRFKLDPPWDLTWAYGAGDIVSNVLDLALWDTALLNGKVLTMPSLRAMWTATALKDGTKVPYGFGWTVETLYGHREIDDNGGLPGYSGRNAAFPNDKFDIVVLANSKSFEAGPLVRQIFELFYPPTKEQIDAQHQGDDAAMMAARAIFRKLQGGTLVAADVTAAASRRLTPALLGQAKSQLGRLGAPTKVDQVDKYAFGTETVYVYRFTFKQAVLGFSVSLDAAGKVGELSIIPL